jgi:hypothetical protein
MENHGGMISTGETPDSSSRALWKFYQQSSGNKEEGTGEGNEFYLTQILRHSICNRLSFLVLLELLLTRLINSVFPKSLPRTGLSISL